MEIYLIIGLICLLAGLAGAILPLPGPPLSYVGLLVMQYGNVIQLSTFWLVMLGLLTAVIAVADYYVPIWGAKKFGGSRYGSIGATIGLIGGLFLGPLGIFIGPFAGALVGELIGGADQKRAFRAALGTFLASLASMGVKVVLCLIMLFVGIRAAWPAISAAFGGN